MKTRIKSCILFLICSNGLSNFTALTCIKGSYDCRGIQTPFVVDTNRYSDGTSSTSVTTTTSPHFSLDSNANSSGEFGAAWAMYELSLNEANQGVANDSVGDARREDARERIVSESNYSSLPAPTSSFGVSAAVKWNPSGFAIQEQERYLLNVNGTQIWYDGELSSDAAGYESYYDSLLGCFAVNGTCHSYLSKRRRMDDAPWLSLICTIGYYYRLVGEIEPGLELSARYLSVDEAKLTKYQFYVGPEKEFIANNTGELLCYANDANTLYWNNRGYLNVTITRTSWPPSNSTYYKELYLPSCDSAQAIYNPNITCNPRSPGGAWGD